MTRNGRRGDWWAAVAALAWLGCAPAAPPSVVLVTLDTTRADHLGPYGYPRARTPALDRFAGQAVLYEAAYSTSSWTLPSHASLFTGLLPMQHGAQTASEGSSRALGYAVRPLSEHFTTLAELLAAAGLRTGGVIGGPALRRELGVAQGFEHYADDFSRPAVAYTGWRARSVTAKALEFLEQVGDAPFFLFVNYFDPHAPYRPPAPHDAGIPAYDEAALYQALVARLSGDAPALPEGQRPAWERRTLAAMRAGYDAEIAYMDHHLGRLLEALDAMPQAAGLLVVITADHGESFGEHDYWSHGAHLYEDNLRVPLLVRHPDGRNAGARVAHPVQNHRAFATILQHVGLPLPESVQLRPLDGAQAVIVAQVGRSDANVRLFGETFDRDLRALYDPPLKLIESSRGEVELYDLARDPGERENLVGAAPEDRRALAERLDRIAATHPPLFDASRRAELEPQTVQALRALGYLD